MPKRTIERRSIERLQAGLGTLLLLFVVRELHAEIQIPEQSDWTPQGVALTPGAPGSWDSRLGGAKSPCGALKIDGTYFLYYIGADGDRSCDGGPRHRAIGVATSADGINFQRYSGNPIVTFIPNPGTTGGEEEGVFTCGAKVDASGNVVLYYGAMTATNPGTCTVGDDVRVAISTDGFAFRCPGTSAPSVNHSVCPDDGIVVDNSDSSAWGGGSLGNEIDPLGTFYHDGNWYVYYNAGDPGGSAVQPWSLGLAWGPDYDNLPNTGPVLDSNGNSVIARSGDDPVWLSSDKLALFNDPDSTGRVEVRTVSPATPDRVSDPVKEYAFGGAVRNPAVLLDTGTNTWFMYHLDSSYTDIHVRTAPVVGADDTPPSTPVGLQAVPLSDERIDLSWSASIDYESGISGYRIYRDNVQIGESQLASYSDRGLVADTTYTYEVTALNGAGLESNTSGPSSATTLTDTTPPFLESVGTSSATEVVVRYSEAVEQSSATTLANYAIDPGISIVSASLDSDLTTVRLTTSEHLETVAYTLTVNDVRDRAQNPNVIASDSQAGYSYESALIISNLTVASGRAYEVADGLDNGSLVYIDRSYTYGPVPATLLGSMYIRTANDDKLSQGSQFLSFDVNRNVSIYVAHDDRYAAVPVWLEDWVDTGLYLQIAGSTHSVYRRDSSGGTVVLGGNSPDGPTNEFSMYVVIVDGGGTSGPSEPPPPPSNVRVY